MKIKSPVLRFVVGLAATAVFLAVLVVLLYGVGSFINAYEFPAPYVIEGIGFWATVALGFAGLLFLYTSVFVLLVVFQISRWLGNRLFGPKK